ncbi:hypothetical protein TNCV_1153261 [Trichonephila clavipes]|nr:hypothetical protein TNCV_1153261 [Trichonephila clavipes]
MSTNQDARFQKQANQRQAPNTLSMGPMMSSDRPGDDFFFRDVLRAPPVSALLRSEVGFQRLFFGGICELHP